MILAPNHAVRGLHDSADGSFWGWSPWAVGLKTSHPWSGRRGGMHWWKLGAIWWARGYKEKNNDEQSIPPGFQIWIYIYIYMIITYDLLSILQNRVQPQVCKIALFQHISYGIMIPNRRVPVRVWSNGLCAPSVFGCYDSSILSISPDDELKYDSWLVLWDFGDGLASQVFKCTTKKEETAMYIVSYRRAVCRLCRQASSCPQWGLFIHVIVWSLCLCTLGH